MTSSQRAAAIVTGGGHGIGAGIARRLAHAGHPVGLLDTDLAGAEATASELRRSGATAIAVETDVSREDDVLSAYARVTDAIGAPLILVNNAGFARDGPLRDMTLSDWDDVQAVHLRGSFLMTRIVLPAMEAGRWGRIIQISSISADGHADRANYCAAKAGMHGFVRGLSVELGPSGITINAIAPGLVVTRMTEATAARRGLSLEAHLADAVTRIPVRRAGTPDDIGALAAFLASDDAGFVTGQVIYASGGV